MDYRVTLKAHAHAHGHKHKCAAPGGRPRIPFRLAPLFDVAKHGRHAIELLLRVRSDFPRQCVARDVCVEFRVPNRAQSLSLFTRTGQRAQGAAAAPAAKLGAVLGKAKAKKCSKRAATPALSKLPEIWNLLLTADLIAAGSASSHAPRGSRSHNTAISELAPPPHPTATRVECVDKNQVFVAS